MNENPYSPVALGLQLLCLATGMLLIYLRKNFSDPFVVLLSGMFFINIFWVTVVLAFDWPVWSALRNSVIGNLILFSIILLNLVAVAVRGFYSNFFK